MAAIQLDQQVMCTQGNKCQRYGACLNTAFL